MSRGFTEWLSRLKFEKRDGLIPVTVLDIVSGKVLMHAYANKEAVARTLETGYAWFYSRSRRKLWMKGETSGNTIKVLRVVADCDFDSLVYEGVPSGPVCHTGAWSCFHNTIADLRGETLWSLVVEAFQQARVVVRRGYGGLDEYLYVINPITDNIPPINPLLLSLLADAIADYLRALEPDAVVTPEALGLPLGTLVAQKLSRPLIVVRKRRYEVEGYEYKYTSGYEEGVYWIPGADINGLKLALVDDTVSTGGTAEAVLSLADKAGAELMAAAFALAKPQYGGLERLKKAGVEAFRIVDVYVRKLPDNRAVLRLEYTSGGRRVAELVVPLVGNA